MCRNIIKLIICSLFFTNISLSQSIDQDVLRNLKASLYNEITHGLLSENAISDYINRTLEYELINSKGFDDIIFVKIPKQIIAIDTIESTKEIVKIFTNYSLEDPNKSYIVGYNKVNSEFYFLKGTNVNNFGAIYAYIANKCSYCLPVGKIDKKMITQFTKEYKVDGIDFRYLLQSINKREVDCR